MSNAVQWEVLTVAYSYLMNSWYYISTICIYCKKVHKKQQTNVNFFAKGTQKLRHDEKEKTYAQTRRLSRHANDRHLSTISSV